MRTNVIMALVIALMGTVGLGCSDQGPARMHYGDDQCDYCKMNIVDPAFGSQLVSDKGKVFKFDSIECLAAYEQTHKSLQTGSTRWLADINQPGSFVEGRKAFIVSGHTLRSPMGLGLAATSRLEDGRQLATETNGRVLSWQEVRDYVAEAWNVR
jgi:copper chaperone NosL